MLKALRDLRNSSDSSDQSFYRAISGAEEQALDSKDCEDDFDDDYDEQDAADLELSMSLLTDVIAQPVIRARADASPEDDPSLDHLVVGFRDSDIRPPADDDANDTEVTEVTPSSTALSGRGKRIRKRNTQFDKDFVHNGDRDKKERTLVGTTFGWLCD